MFKQISAGVCGLLMALAAVPAGAANLLTNGSFEGGPVNNFGEGYYRGPLAPDGWSRVVGLEAPDILSNSYVQTGAGFAQLLGAQDGVRYLDMNGASATGELYQDIGGLSAGASITLTYWVGRWAQNSAGSLTASLLNGTTLAVLESQLTTVDYLPEATSSTWALMTLTAVAPISGVVRVQFAGDSGSTSRGAPGLDNVAFSAVGGGVPEPGTWALMIGGFGMAGAMIRRRKALAGVVSPK